MKKIVVIVAHPDDETLWCGGTILQHPNCNWYIACLCRKNDPDRAPKFKKTLTILKAEGIMGNLDDGASQRRLDRKALENTILDLLPSRNFDLIITHSPFGEYTRHLRHEETGNAVISLWNKTKINSKELWTFAYEDGNKEYLPQAISNANLFQTLPENIWKEKYQIITEIYGFEKTGFEAKSTPKSEAFWILKNPKDAKEWVDREKSKHKP